MKPSTLVVVGFSILSHTKIDGGIHIVYISVDSIAILCSRIYNKEKGGDSYEH